MLSILRVISQNREHSNDPKVPISTQIRKDNLKIIYVCVPCLVCSGVKWDDVYLFLAQ